MEPGEINIPKRTSTSELSDVPLSAPIVIVEAEGDNIRKLRSSVKRIQMKKPKKTNNLPKMFRRNYIDLVYTKEGDIELKDENNQKSSSRSISQDTSNAEQNNQELKNNKSFFGRFKTFCSGFWNSAFKESNNESVVQTREIRSEDQNDDKQGDCKIGELMDTNEKFEQS